VTDSILVSLSVTLRHHLFHLACGDGERERTKRTNVDKTLMRRDPHPEDGRVWFEMVAPSEWLADEDGGTAEECSDALHLRDLLIRVQKDAGPFSHRCRAEARRCLDLLDARLDTPIVDRVAVLGLLAETKKPARPKKSGKNARKR
jgi:hypothetical protein